MLDADFYFEFALQFVNKPALDNAIKLQPMRFFLCTRSSVLIDGSVVPDVFEDWQFLSAFSL